MAREQDFTANRVLIAAALFWLSAAPVLADDGRVYQPPLGNSRYVYPFNYHKFKVPQKLGYGFYPTYWRDWHDNPDAVLTELRPNRKPYQKKKKQKVEPAETKPTDQTQPNGATEEDTLPPPPVEPELPPQETPDVPSDSLELPSGNLELPSEQPSEPATTPPSTRPETPSPAETDSPSTPEAETPTEPTQPDTTAPKADTGEPTPQEAPTGADPLALPPLEGPPTEEPMSQVDDGPSLYKRPTQKTAAARATNRKPLRHLTEEQTLQSLGSKFDQDSADESATETVEQASTEPNGVEAVRAAMQFQPRPKRQSRTNTPTSSPVRRATYLDDATPGRMHNVHAAPEQHANTPRRLSHGAAMPGRTNPLRAAEYPPRDRADLAPRHANPLRGSDSEVR